MLSHSIRAARVHQSAVRDAAMPIRRWPERRAVVLTVVALLFGAIYGLLATRPDADAGAGLLFVIPTALAALELGLAGGVAAAVTAFALVAASGLGTDTELSALGYASRGLAFVSVGA